MSRTSFGEEVDRVVDIVSAALPTGFDTTIGPPQALDAGNGIDVTLHTATPAIAKVRSDRRHLPGELVVVLGVRAEGSESVDVLHDLWAALDESAYAFSPFDPGAEWWSAFGVEPRPIVSIEIPVLVERSVDRGAIVLEDIKVINTVDSPDREVKARVVGPGERPIEGARVTSPQSPALVTSTDHQGYFSLRGYFAGDSVPIEVRHYHLSAQVDLPIEATDHVVAITASSSDERRDN